MKYRFVQEHQDYSDLAMGRVFHSLPGYTPFPVRLASEIFQRCVAIRQDQGQKGPCVLYDPCCGSGYLLAVLLYLHADALDVVVGSDINPEGLSLAERNLALLTPEGITARIGQIANMLAAFGKTSHQEALMSAQRIHRHLVEHAVPKVPTRLFLADATDKVMISDGLGSLKPDIVVTDVPYGQHSAWAFSGSTTPLPIKPTSAMLDALLPVLPEGAVVAITSDKSQKVSHSAYRRVVHFQIGKRRVVFLTPHSTSAADR
jgi:hypothetical protein